MRKYINDPNVVVDEMLEGFLAVDPEARLGMEYCAQAFPSRKLDMKIRNS